MSDGKFFGCVAFVALGLVALAVAVAANRTYDNREMFYELTQNQKSIVLPLGESFQTFIYNVKEPIDVVFKAPEDSKIVIGGKEYSNYKMRIQPQEPIAKGFHIRENGKEKTEIIESHVSTYKEVFKPINRRVLTEGSGKHEKKVGQKIYYTLNDNNKEILVDLHEHNREEKHYFYYLNGTKDVLIRMIAPKYNSFVFENGKKTKEYTFKLKKGDDYLFAMKLSQDNVEHTYNRTYRFNRK
jgi:hypothetical protein